MSTKKYQVKLSPEARHELLLLTRKGVHPTRKVARARILLLADEERRYEDIATYLHCSSARVSRICRRYCLEGFSSALEEQPRSGAPRKLDGRFEAKVSVLACSTPPEGRARWTLRLLADQLVELGWIEAITHTDVRRILDKNALKPWLKKHWCIGHITTEFLWLMENILDLYEQPYNPKRPLLCFDERPCQLIGEIITPLPMEAGQPEREDYQYARHGVCTLMIAFEPLTGQRIIQVFPHRTKLEYASFMKTLADTHYAHAAQLLLVQDNLNTHTPGSFYAAFPAEDAFALAQRFEMHYTPKHASWLNMVEIELSALSKQCLDRRISDMETLQREALAWANERNEQRVTVQWRFTKNDARTKLQRHYPY